MGEGSCLPTDGLPTSRERRGLTGFDGAEGPAAALHDVSMHVTMAVSLPVKHVDPCPCRHYAVQAWVMC